MTARRSRSPAPAPVRAVSACSVRPRSRVVSDPDPGGQVVGALREELRLLMLFRLLRAPRFVDLRSVMLHRGDHHRSGGYARDDTPHAIDVRVRCVFCPKPEVMMKRRD